MTEKVKTQAPLILTEIQKAKHILLHCHPSPDPDSVGSSLAMKLVLEQLGKKVTLIKGDSDIPKDFAFPGVDTITQKSYSEINITDFDLFIILDSGSIEMVSRTKPVFPEGLATVVIDHHASNKGYGTINLIDSTYAATAELLADLFMVIGVKIDHDIALNLFMGIFTDTGGFRYMNTTVNTFEVTTMLVKLAPDYSKIIAIMENSRNRESLLLEGKLLSSIKTFFDNKLAIASISFKELSNNNFNADDIITGTISNKLKSVKDTYIGVTLIEVEDGYIKASFRTKDADKYDVSKLAISLGGGGHIAASGAKLNMNIEQAIDIVAKKAQELYNL